MKSAVSDEKIEKEQIRLVSNSICCSLGFLFNGDRHRFSGELENAGK